MLGVGRGRARFGHLGGACPASPAPVAPPAADPASPTPPDAPRRLLTFITLLLGQLWWANFWACTCFLTGIFAASAWSGANWYFHIFAGRAPRRPRASATPSQQPDAASPVLSSARKRA